jgi:hypothetical protein
VVQQFYGVVLVNDWHVNRGCGFIGQHDYGAEAEQRDQYGGDEFGFFGHFIPPIVLESFLNKEE